MLILILIRVLLLEMIYSGQVLLKTKLLVLLESYLEPQRKTITFSIEKRSSFKTLRELNDKKYISIFGWKLSLIIIYLFFLSFATIF